MALTPFSRWINDNTKFIALNVDEATASQLREVAHQHQLDLSRDYDQHVISPYDFDFHCTVIMGKPDAPIANGRFPLDSTVHTKVIRPEALGPQKDIPVLIVDANEEMIHVRQLLEEAYQIKSSWPTWIPHISLSYSTKVGGERQWTGADISGIPICFTSITVSDSSK